MAVTPPPTRPEPGDATRQERPRATAGKRRTLYGLNVAVAVGVAIAVVILANVLIDWQFRRLPAGVKPWLRYDLTATRAFTLSPQTQQLLGRLDEPLRVVGVVRDETEVGRDVVDLLQQYGRSTSRLDVQVLHPERDLSRIEAFYRELEDRHSDQTQPLREVIVRGINTLDRLAGVFAQASETVAVLAAEEAEEAGELQQTLRVLANQLEGLSRGYAEGTAALRGQMDKPMPPLNNARNALVNDLRRADAEVLSPFVRQLGPRTRDRDATLRVRDTLLRLQEQMEALRGELREEAETLLLPPSADAYERLRSAMAGGGGGGEVVVVLSEKASRVVSIAEMFVAGATPAERLFIGEDRLTGAMLTMGIDVPPRLVVVRDTPQSLVATQGGLAHVASRMALADFEVAEWSVGSGGRRGPTAGAAARWPRPPRRPRGRPRSGSCPL